MNLKTKLTLLGFGLGALVFAGAITWLVVPDSVSGVLDKYAAEPDGPDAVAASHRGGLSSREVTAANRMRDEPGVVIGTGGQPVPIAVAVPQEGESDIDKNWDHLPPEERKAFLSEKFEGAMASLERGSPSWKTVDQAGDALTRVPGRLL